MVFDLVRPGLPQTDPTLLRLRLLGRMEARSISGASVIPVGGKTRGLLAILALADRQPVSRNTLAELLWSRRPDDLARASLRQEIHRLLDALSPLGVDVIDVQRHTLALKPALTSVDVERLYAVGMPVLEEVGMPPPVLLGELNGLDPAFDAWLEEQRGKVLRYVVTVLTDAISGYADPAAQRDAADRLLLLDSCNEVAWRGRIAASIALGEHAQALRHAEEAISVFERLTSRSPGPQTMRLIDAARAHGGSADVAVLATRDVQAPPQTGRSPAEHYPNSRDAARYLATLTILPVRLPSGGGTDLTPVAEMIEDYFDQVLPEHLLSVAIKSAAADEGDSSNRSVMRARQTGADFALSSVLRISPPTADGREEVRLVLRLLDVRHDAPAIVRAAILPLPPVASTALTTEYLAETRYHLVNFARQLLWTIALYEARRVSHRLQRELGAMGRTMRALTLLTRCDVQLAPEIESLLYDDDRGEAGIQLRFLVKATFEITREHVFLMGPGTADPPDSHENSAQQYHAERPESDLAVLVLGIQAMLTPGQMERAELLAKALRARVAQGMAPDFTQLSMIEAAISLWRGEDNETVHRHLDRYEEERDETLICGLTDATVALIGFLAGRQERVARSIRLQTSLYPRNPLALVCQLVTEADRGAQDECARTLSQINAALPGITISRVLDAVPYLREAHRSALARILVAAGMPQGTAVDTLMAKLGVQDGARYVG